MPRWEFENIVLSPRQEQIILGTSLGDGSLSIGKRSRNARFSTSSRNQDREYVFWKYRELESTGLFLHPPQQRLRQTPFGSSFGWGLRSRAHPVFTEFHRLFYPDGKKTAPVEVLDKLDDFGLAIWYQDDGYFHWHHSEYPRVSLCTYGFSLEENQVIGDWFKGKYGLLFKLQTRPRALGGKAYRLALGRTQEVQRFLDIVKPHIHPCMGRKLGGS